MNFLITSLIVIGMPLQVFAATPTSCTFENSQKLASLAAKFIGETSADDQKLSKIMQNDKISDVKEIRKQYVQVRTSSKAGAAAEEVMSFAKAHPECDKDGNFRITRPVN